jgi:flagellar motor switch protein FliN/FliY
MTTDSIQYNKIEESEKVIKTLADVIETGFSDAFRELNDEALSLTCTVVERGNLQAILRASPEPVNGIEVRYHTGLAGNALLLFGLGDFLSLVGVLSGVEGLAKGNVPPEALEVCSRYFSRAFQLCNQQFLARHQQQIDSDPPELINPDGKLLDLLPLSGSYDGVLCLGFQLSSGPRLAGRFQMLVQPDLKESLMFLLPDFAAASPSPGFIAQAAAPQKEVSHPMPNMQEAAIAKTVANSSPAKPNPDWNIDLLLDVELPIVVSFGEAEMPLKDVLKLGVGSVIELDKSVNDPVTVIVNQKPIARGEVVMVDGNYGVRILEVESTADRIRSLG